MNPAEMLFLPCINEHITKGFFQIGHKIIFIRKSLFEPMIKCIENTIVDHMLTEKQKQLQTRIII